MQVHTAWVEAAFKSVPALATKTFVTVARYASPNESTVVTTPYVVLHPADGVDAAERFTGPKSVQRPRFTVHIVGSSAEQVAVITRLAKAKFIVGGFGVFPVIAGESCRRVFWEVPQPIQIDTDVTPELVYATIELGFDSMTA